MILLLFVAFLSGLATILAPCIWPLLPIVLSTSLSGGKGKSLGITLGIVLTFGIFNIAISYLVKIFNFDPNILRNASVILLVFLGILMIVPRFAQSFEAFVSTFAGRFGQKGTAQNGFLGGLVTGISLGIVWTPCAGPILAAITALSTSSQLNFGIILITFAYLIGVAIPLFAFSYGGQRFITQSKSLSKHLGIVQQIFGVLLILTALAIATNYDKIIQIKILDSLPAYTNFLTSFESSPKVLEQLDKLKGKGPTSLPALNPFASQSQNLKDLGPSPEIAGITGWLNSDPLTLADLKGKVVLVDFWTYTCINCIRTLPYVTSWYEKYKDEGFVVLGVHTPEFEFEKKTENVKNAISSYKITYPVAQDNDYRTWNAFKNRYWPAKYLVDKNGHIRYSHFGEGKYEETEMAIQKLLAETGSSSPQSLTQLDEQSPTGNLTPETYLGTARINRFASKVQAQNGTDTYSLNPILPEDFFTLGGTWTLTDEYAESQKGSTLEINFYASKVFLVITPKTTSDEIKVYLDGKPVTESLAGSDVKNGILRANEPRLYNLIDLKGDKNNHILHLEFETDGTQVFAFTFG